MESEVAQLPEQKMTDDKRIGREIAFGIQQTLACWSTDFIDPPVSKFLQRRYGNPDHKVTDAHVWGGEVIGDSAAFFIYMGIKRMLGKPVDGVISGVKRMFDGRLASMGQKAIAPWAKEEGIEPQDARYQRKLEAYKQFQAENVVDSSIVATSATLSNVAFQRMIGNRQSYKVILGSKLVGAAATMSVMLGLRTAMPTAMETLDNELDDRYFSKLVRVTKKAFGVKDDEKQEVPPPTRTSAVSYPPLVEIGMGTTLASLVAQKAMHREHELTELLPKSIGLGALVTAGVLSLRAIMPTTARTFNEEAAKRYMGKLGGGKPVDEGHATPPEETPLAQAPMVEKPLGEEKRQQFMSWLQRNYRKGGQALTWDAYIAEQKQLCDAFVSVLAPDGAFASAIAEAHYKALHKLNGAADEKSILPDATLRQSATLNMQSILINRRDDMLASRALLDDPAFLSELQMRIQQPEEKKRSGLSLKKKAWLVESLVQTRGPLKREPAVHIHANAKGQLLEHAALADCFNPVGPAAQVLADGLGKHMQKDMTEIAADYLRDRRNAAQLVVEELRLDGEIVKEAVKQSEQVRLREGKLAARAPRPRPSPEALRSFTQRFGGDAPVLRGA